jgi:hypothetical protein
MKSVAFLLSLFILLTVSPSLLANDDLDHLLKERKVLYKDFEYYQNQKSSFWGTQSKKDLRKAIEVLKRIIVKDSEIIKQINIKHTKKNVQVMSKNQVSQDYTYDLEYENNKLKLLLNKTTFDYNQTVEENEVLKSSNSINNSILFGLVVLMIGLVIYIFRLRETIKTRIEDTKIRSIINESRVASVQKQGKLAAGGN